MKPNYNNCVMNLISSIEKKYGYQSKFKSLKYIDKLIENKKHVFLILLDGFGKNIIKYNLDKTSFIKNNVIKYISTIYPPTTVAVTDAILSNKLPSETGWFGWHQYFKEFDKHIVMFRGFDQYTKEDLNINIRDILPFDNFYDKYQKDGVKTFSLYPSFMQNGFSSFKGQCDEMIKINKMDEQTFTYVYWDEPDSTIHENGCYNDKVKEVSTLLDNDLKYLSDNLNDDSIFIMIADHGLVDVEFIYLKDHEISKYLNLLPSIESRTTAFSVNNKEEFERIFNKHFKKHFKLYKSEDFLNSKYLYHKVSKEKLRPFLLDYVAVAKGKYAFSYEENKQFTMKANHAGSCKDEFIIPIVINKKNINK